MNLLWFVNLKILVLLQHLISSDQHWLLKVVQSACKAKWSHSSCYTISTFNFHFLTYHQVKIKYKLNILAGFPSDHIAFVAIQTLDSEQTTNQTLHTHNKITVVLTEPDWPLKLIRICWQIIWQFSDQYWILYYINLSFLVSTLTFLMANRNWIFIKSK